MTVSGGTITGATPVYAKSGAIDISGGTFTAIGTAQDYSNRPNGNPNWVTGDAIMIDNCGYPGGAPTVSITGGTFISQNAKSVGSYAKDETFTALAEFIAADGTALFSDTTADGVPAGYTLVADETHTNPQLYKIAYDGVVYPTGEETVGVPIPNSWIKDNSVTGTTTNEKIADLGTTGANGLLKWQSYVLGLNPKVATSQVKLEGAKASADGKVAIKGLNVNVPAVLAAQGTTVIFHLEESVPGSDSWTVRSETFAVEDGKPVFTVPLSDVNGKVLRIMADIVTVSK